MISGTRAILFDYDDTLVQTRICKFAAIRFVAQHHYGFKLDDEAIDRHWGIPYRDLFVALFGAHDADIARVIERYEACEATHPVVAYPDAIPTLSRLVELERVVAIVSSAGDIIHRQLRYAGFPLDALLFVQTANDTRYHKPDPRVFAPALEKLSRIGIGPGDVTYVGDSLRDFEASERAGLCFIGVHGRTTHRERFEAVGARNVATLWDLLPTEHSDG